MTSLTFRPVCMGMLSGELPLALHSLIAEGSGLLSGQGAEIPQATGRGQKKKVLSEAVGAEGQERCR